MVKLDRNLLVSEKALEAARRQYIGHDVAIDRAVCAAAPIIIAEFMQQIADGAAEIAEALSHD